jgi:outer membrane protein OmpA-like peptidoglycan-associated protein
MKLPKQIAVYSFLAMFFAVGGILRAQDHPLIKAYPGSMGGIKSQQEFDEYELITGPLKDSKLTKSQHLEGKITEIQYITPAGRSVLEVYRNYEAALKQAGFQVLFACNAAECGTGWLRVKGLEDVMAGQANTRVLTAKLAKAEGDVYVALHMPASGGKTILNIIELKPMDTGMVAVNAAALANDIGKQGHAAIYGIFFDTGKADIKPESEPTLAEIAKLLQQDSALKVHVVGHTDSTGNLVMNMDLSRRRANSVVQALATKHGIAAARMRPDGVGPLAPVASNDAEEGRAKNRRVELVKQ